MVVTLSVRLSPLCLSHEQCPCGHIAGKVGVAFELSDGQVWLLMGYFAYKFGVLLGVSLLSGSRSDRVSVFVILSGCLVSLSWSDGRLAVVLCTGQG